MNYYNIHQNSLYSDQVTLSLVQIRNASDRAENSARYASEAHKSLRYLLELRQTLIKRQRTVLLDAKVVDKQLKMPVTVSKSGTVPGLMWQHKLSGKDANIGSETAAPRLVLRIDAPGSLHSSSLDNLPPFTAAPARKENRGVQSPVTHYRLMGEH